MTDANAVCQPKETMESIAFYTSLSVLFILCGFMVYIDNKLRFAHQSCSCDHCDSFNDSECEPAWHVSSEPGFVQEGDSPPSSGELPPAESLDIIDTCGVDTPITLKCPTDSKRL